LIDGTAYEAFGRPPAWSDGRFAVAPFDALANLLEAKD
jgi:hypothetical protein